MRCESETCKRPAHEANAEGGCIFAGYGWMVAFHEECCPIVLGGEECLGVHAEEAEAMFKARQEAKHVN